MVRASTRRSAGYVISCFKFRNLFFLSQKLKQVRGTNCLPLGSDHKRFHMSMSRAQKPGILLQSHLNAQSLYRQVYSGTTIRAYIFYF